MNNNTNKEGFANIMTKSNEIIEQKINDSAFFCPKISSLYYTVESFKKNCSEFLNENKYLNLDGISLFFQENSTMEEKKKFISQFTEWIGNLREKVPELDKITYKIFFLKLLGITLIFKFAFNYKEFSNIIHFFYSSLKLQDFKSLRDEFTEILYLMIQNFHFLSIQEKEKDHNFQGEILLMKCICLVSINNYQNLNYDFMPLILKTIHVINENLCQNLIKETGNKYPLKRIFSKIINKSAKLLEFFSSLPESQAQNKIKPEVYDCIHTSFIYSILLDEEDESGTIIYKKISQIDNINEIIKNENSEKIYELSLKTFRNEFTNHIKSEKKSICEKENIKFIKNLEIFLKNLLEGLKSKNLTEHPEIKMIYQKFLFIFFEIVT